MPTTKDLVTGYTDKEDVNETNNSRSEFEEEGQGKVTDHGMTTGDATTDGAMARTAALARGDTKSSSVPGQSTVSGAPFSRKDGTALNRTESGREAAVTAQLRSFQRS